VLDRLAEPDAGVEHDLLLADAGGNGKRQALLEEAEDIVDDVLVVGVVLHGLRRPEHVHQAYGAPGLGDDLGHRRIAAQRGDVVDDRRSRDQRATRDLGFGRVHRDGRRDLAAQGGHDGDDARRLLVDRRRIGPGPRRFAADVDDRGTVRGHGLALTESGFGMDEKATVRERVRGHVEDPHHAREIEITLQEEGIGHQGSLNLR